MPLEVKNNAQKSFNSMYIDGIIEKIKSIQEDYFNSSSEKDKNNIKHRFDIVITNPPYFRFNNKKHAKNINFFKNNELYKLACVRKINEYEVSLLFSYTQCKDLGIICEIFQNSFLADDAAKK